MATHHNTAVPLTADSLPMDAGTDLFSQWLFQPALPGSTLHDDGFATRMGWENPIQSLSSMESPHGMFEYRGAQDMARGSGFDLVAASLLPLKWVDIDITGAASPAPVMFGKADSGMSVLDAIGAVVTLTSSSAADTPLAAQNAPNPAATPNATVLVAPQVLASGTWLINPQVTLKTSLGNIVVELYPNAAPVTVANHLAYVSSGFFDDLLFHRVVPGFVVQGGGFASGLVQKAPPYAPITLESDNGLSNDRGTLGMARTSAADSATSQFYFNLVNNVSLNYVNASSPGYAVFGKVLTGLSVVDAIAAVPTSGPNNVPVTDVKILEADQTRQGTLHSTSGRIDIGILVAPPPTAWTGEPVFSWEYSLDAGANWAPGASTGNFTAPQGAYEFGTIQLRYRDAQHNVGSSNSTGGNVVVDTRVIIAGDGGANTLTGTSAVDTMYGLGGNDTLDGGGGADSMVGGTGNDTYIVQSSADKTVESAGGGTDVVNASVAWTLASNVEKLTLTGSTAINGTGNTLANTITGNTAANLLAGGSGNDTINGSSGNDTLDGGTGNDSLIGGTGNDSYTVDSGTDVISETTTTVTEIDSVTSSVAWTLGSNLEKLTLTGSTAINGTGNTLANTITGNTAANLLAGGSGNDTINGSSGNDTLDGGTGNDSLTGGTGNDSYTVDSGTDVISETTTTVTEIDSVTSSVAWTLGSNLEKLTLTGSTAINGTGNTLANTITGNTAANLLAGGGGNDTISGGSGNDSVDGGSGNDSLTGGSGLDTFRFSSALNGSNNVDVVSGFLAVEDAIQLENGVFLKLTAIGVLSATFFHASSTGAAADGNDYINYETDTGKLFYDADGNGAGAAVFFATLSGAPALSSADIFVT